MPARRHLSLAALLLAAAALAAEACSDAPRPIGGGMASGFAVVNGNFTSTSISLLSPAGDLVTGDCIHSTTVNGTATISGDVVLPSQPQHGGKLVLIDRGNTALTFVDPATCTVDHQFSVKAGFNFANPHDVVILDDTKAYVTRYGVNPAPTDALSKGDDILIVDPRDGTVAGTIDLSSYAVPTASVTMHARPDRALLADGKVFVSLNEASDFPTDLNGTVTYAEGHLVVVDPASDGVTQDIALGGLTGCEAMTYLADDKLLLVVCGGSFGADPAADSGIALVFLGGSTPELIGAISAVGFADRAVSFQGIAARVAGGKRQAFVNTLGAFASASSDAVPDQTVVVDLDAGAAAGVASSTAYDLGAPALAGTKLLLPDATASMPRLRVVDVSAAAPTETAAFVTDAANGLPPRLVAAY